MLNEEDVHGQVLDHLGLVSSVISRLKLIEKIDARIKVSKDNGAKVTMGQRVAAMILNGLGFTDDRLYLFPQFLENKPIGRLLGQGLSANDFNDDALGRCLDAISDYGVTPFFSEYVGDSAFYERCVKAQVPFKWLSRAPERLNEVKKWVQLPEDTFTWQLLGNGYKMTPLLDAVYGDVSQRWIMIFSEKAATRELKTLKKQIQKELDEYSKVVWHLSNQEFKCNHDAQRAGLEAVKGLKYHQVTWTTNPIEKHSGRGRPKKDAALVTLGCRITGEITENSRQIELIKCCKGRFILATNQLDQKVLPDIELLSEYKKQYKTEQGFAFIKGDTFEVASIFLKKPSRIEALMMIMTLCLMVYSFAQYQLRQALEKANETIPDQQKKPTKTPSMAWVFRLFHGIQVWIVRQHDLNQELVVNLNSLKRRIIQYFGPEATRIYSASG